MPVACHGKVSTGFCQRKTANLIDSWSYFYFQTFCDWASMRDSVILVRTVIFKHDSCDSGKEHSAILRFWPRRAGNKHKVRHFKRNFAILYWIEHRPLRVTHRANKFAVRSATQPAKRTNEFSIQTCVFIRPTCVTFSLNKIEDWKNFDTPYSLDQCIHKSRSQSRKTSTLTISKIGSNICWFAIEDF